MTRILFITSNRLGDAVISTGVLDALQHRYPGAMFTVVCGPVPAGLFADDPRCERVLVMEKRRYDRHWIDLWTQCIGTRWFMIVDLRGSLLGLTLWARRRIIVRGGRRPGLRVEHLARALGFRHTPMPRVWTSEAQRERARVCLPEGRWLALGPTANWHGKIWPPERFVALAKALQEQGMRVAVFYGPGEQERRLATPVLDALPDARDLGGNHALGNVAALLARCTLFIGNDSGLMHLAAATGISTLGVFGPSKASEYAPAGKCAHFVEAPGPEGRAPIDGLPAQRVINAARDILRQAPIANAHSSVEPT